MNIDELADILERGGAKIDRATFPTLMRSPEYAEKVRSLLESGGATVPDSSAFYQKFTTQAEPAAPVAPKAAPGWSEALFPALSATIARQGQSRPADPVPDGLDAVSGAGYRLGPGILANKIERQWPAARDLLTMPLRAAAGAGAALGQTIGGADGLGGLLQGIGLRRPDVSEAYRSAMASPSSEVQEMAPFAPSALRYVANPSMYAGMAEDPATAPAMAIGGTSLSPLAQGIATSGVMMGRTALDEQPMNVADLIPTAIGGLGALAPSVARYGGTLKDKAKDLIVSQIKGLKPEIADDLRRGLTTHFPHVVGRTTGTVGGMVGRYTDLLRGLGREYSPVVDAMEASGRKVKVGPIMQAAEKKLAETGAARAGGAYDPATGGRTMNWLERRVGATDDPALFAEAMRGGAAPSTALEIGPRAAHGMQSALRRAALQAANENDEKVIASLAAGTEAADQLKAMFPAYADITKRAAPIYAMRRAMEVAARRQNRNPISLSSAAAPITTIQEIPATARAMWDVGGLLQGIQTPQGATALPLFFQPDERRAR